MADLAEQVVVLPGKGDFVFGRRILILNRLPQVVGGLITIQNR